MDQTPLKFLIEQMVVQLEYKKSVSKLLGYEFEIQYCLGLRNKVADALSRVPEAAHLANLSVPLAKSKRPLSD